MMSAMDWAIFNELRLEGRLCDAVISVDGVEFNIHRNVLCACSPYFRVLFTSSWSNAEKTVYKINGISPEMMKLIIDYAYTWTVPVTADNAEDLLIAADQFNVMGTIRECCEFLKSQLCPENAVGIYRFTEYYYCPDLREAAYVFILHHFQEVTRVSTEYLDLSVNQLENIIEQDGLKVRQEETVFEAVLKWIAHDPQDRRRHTAVLLGKVRLALMQADYFMNNILTHNYIMDNEECKALIVNTLTEMDHLSVHGPSRAGFPSLLSRPRLPHAIMFAVGGWGGGSPTNAMETYDVRADTWVNVPCEQERPLAYHGTAYLKGFIYVIGGSDGTDYFNGVKRFDPLQKTWQQVGPMHARRCHVCVTVLDNHIYAMGGFDGHTHLNTAERYDPDTNQWTLIAPMQEPRCDASATMLHGKVYVCGGFNGPNFSNTAEVYDPQTNQWTFITPMGSRRSGAGVIAYGNKVYAVGGFDGITHLRSAEAYNPTTNAWRAIPPMVNPRSNFGIEVVDDCVFVVGGFNDVSATSRVECYNDQANAWNNVEEMGINRGALSCCVVPGLPNVRDYAARRD